MAAAVDEELPTSARRDEDFFSSLAALEAEIGGQESKGPVEEGSSVDEGMEMGGEGAGGGIDLRCRTLAKELMEAVSSGYFGPAIVPEAHDVGVEATKKQKILLHELLKEVEAPEAVVSVLGNQSLVRKILAAVYAIDGKSLVRSLALCGVNRNFRAAALASPLLWRKLDLSQMEASRALRSIVPTENGEFGGEPNWREDFVKETQKVLDGVLQHVRCVKLSTALSIHMPSLLLDSNIHEVTVAPGFEVAEGGSEYPLRPGSRVMSEEQVGLLSRTTPQLQRLTLHGVHMSIQTIEGIASAIGSAWCNVTELSIENDGSNTMVQGLCSQMPRLQRLRLSGCKCITTEGLIPVVSTCHPLVELRIADIGGGIDGAEDASFLRSMVQAHKASIRILDLSSGFGNKDQWVNDDVLRLISSCSSVEELNLARCSDITHVGISSIVSCLNLRHLDISSCTQLTEASVLQVISSSPLETLVLSGCTQLSDRVLAEISSSCPTLKDLTVFGLFGILTDAALLPLVRAGVKVSGRNVLNSIPALLEKALDLMETDEEVSPPPTTVAVATPPEESDELMADPEEAREAQQFAENVFLP